MRARISIAALLLATTAQAGSLDANLAARFAAQQPGQDLPVIVRFTEHVSPSKYAGGPRTASAFITALHDAAARRQAGAIALLQARGLAGGMRVLWIDNSLAVRATSQLAAELASLPDVESVEYDEPVFGATGPPLAGVDAVLAQAPVWSLIKVNVPQVWSALGLTGAGITVGSMDTGCDISHPALAGKWRGGANSWHDFVNGLASPYDDHGHGTHTIGTMVGGDAGGAFTPDIGVAPGANFICCKVLDATNSFSSGSIVVAGAQWMLDPDGNPATNDFPQVINNSWLFFSQTYAGYHATMDAWRAVGIIPVFCIANNGPAAGTTNPPGNYDNVIGVGATDSLDVIAVYSSRGPSPSGAGFPSDLRKPDLCAPGSSVTSSLPGGSYGDWFGTSMATPAVSGTVALMLQAHPGLTYAQARSMLIDNAVDLGAAGYDYNYGYGRLNAYASVLSAAAGVAPAGGARAAALKCWPNPARGAVTFAIVSTGGGPAVLDVLDLQGRRVWSARSAGTGTVSWDGRDGRGTRLPAGVYLARLTDGAATRSGRVLLLN
jgi:subtilisin family serine protease